MGKAFQVAQQAVHHFKQSCQSLLLTKETSLTSEKQATLFPFWEGRLRIKNCPWTIRPGIPKLQL